MSGIQLTHGMARDEWSELVRRGKISVSWERAWTRKQEKRRLLKKLCRDPEVQVKRRTAVTAAQAKMPVKPWQIARRHGNHPYPPLPPMNRKEFNRYTYLRRMTSRENALAVVMAEREAQRG